MAGKGLAVEGDSKEFQPVHIGVFGTSKLNDVIRMKFNLRAVCRLSGIEARL